MSASMPLSRPGALLDRGAAAVLAIVLGLFLAPELAWIAWGPALPSSAWPAIETRALVASALLALLLPLVQIVVHIRLVGGDAIRGNRDAFPALPGAAGRIVRAHANLVESFAPFAAVVLVAHAAGASSRTTAAAAVLYFAARLVHASTYALGITVIRSAAFYSGVIATIQIAVTALTAG